ncbi:leucine-rich repeat domain-containing protein [Kitasatospora sp. NPDC059571]|uniref:leucine-rich repeat domain-containing protein n=1 Tax=Kitasatospora sp. NPDC059571 TaxID=3346871 RepID=UPI0036B8C4F0
MSEELKPQVFANRWAGAVAPGDHERSRDECRCLRPPRRRPRHRPTAFHREVQDTTAPGWLRLLDLVEEAAADGREVFAPLVELTPEQRRQVVTLPPTIARLTAVQHLDLYGSNLVRVPPEIGAMQSLEEFTPYRSLRLHWFPYEITRCRNLRHSTVSTRALYGSETYRSPFPLLSAPANAAHGADPADLPPRAWGVTAIRTCSVCDRRIAGTEGLRQVWISLWTSGRDVLPLLVNACSAACVDALPAPAEGYVPHPHTGGLAVVQPDPED